MTLNLYKRVLMFFLQFLAAVHISRMNCSAMAGDRLEQAAHKILKHRTHIYNHLSFDLLNSRSIPHGGDRFGYSSKTRCYFIACCTLIAKMVGPLLLHVT